MTTPVCRRSQVFHLVVFIFSVLLSLLLFSNSAEAAIVLDSASSAAVSTAKGSLIWSHTGSGTSTVLIVGVSINGNTTVSTVTYGGISLTRLVTRNQGTQTRASLWYLPNPPTGTKNIVVTMSGNAVFVAGAQSFKGVNLNNPIGTPAVNSGASDLASTLSVLGAAGEVVVDVIARRGDLTTNPLTASAGQSSGWNLRAGLNNSNSGVTGGGSHKAGSSLVTMSWTWPSKRAWAAAGVSLKPVPPLGDTTPPLRFSAAPSGTFPSGTTNTTLSINTDENATCKYSIVTGIAYASMSNIFSTTGGTSHSQSIAGLTNGTSYTYYLRCMDVGGNSNNTDVTVSFSVAPFVDVTAPSVPTGLTLGSVSAEEVIFSWDASSDDVDVHGYKIYRNRTLIGSTIVTNFSGFGIVQLTHYSYTVSAFDAAGNESAQSSPLTVMTPAFTVPTPLRDLNGRRNSNGTRTSWAIKTDPTLPEAKSNPVSDQMSQNSQFTIYGTPLTKDLFFGQQDMEVEYLQKFLAQFPALYPESLVTGYFGPLTRQAVERFQCKYNIVCSGTPNENGYGRVGPRTRNVINEMLFGSVSAESPVVQTGTWSSISALWFGVSGPEVSALQRSLAKDSSIYPQGLVTGYFGELTREAVRRFQCMNNIVCSGDESSTGYGRVGAVTSNAINKQLDI